MITKKETIVDTFCTFHDGDIIFDKEEESNQIWKIDCQYLAEMINPKYNHFWIKIYNYSFIQFHPWMNPIDLPEEVWTNMEGIFQTELEISSAEKKDNKVVILCNQHNSDFNFCGGELLLECKGIEVFDQEWNKIEFEQLRKICNSYWNKPK